MTNSNQLTREISSVIYPKAVLIAYVSEDEKKHFLEMLAIDKKGNMGEGRPVTLEFMNDLVRNYSEVHDSTPCGILPPNLLYCDTRKGSERYVWYNPPQRRMMYFVESLKIENAEYNVPGVIYESKEGGGMNVYAFKGEVPTPETKLYAAPFFNVTSASVCMGNPKIESPRQPTFGTFLEYLEKRFWLTEFSHLGGGRNPTKSNLVLVTKAARDKPFNLNELIPLNNLKLKDLLK